MPTKMATAAVLSAAGDSIAQNFLGSDPFSLRRLLTIVAVNVGYIVPVLTMFYDANERLAAKLRLRAGWAKTSAQLAFDQLINAPIVIAGFFTAFQFASALAEFLVTGTPVSCSGLANALGTQLRTSYVSTLLSNWRVWVLPQLINFALVPPYARVAFANAIALVWNVVLSVMANR